MNSSFFLSSTSGTKQGNRSSTMRTGDQLLTLFIAIIIGRLLQRDSWWCLSNAVATEIISKNPANRKRSELVMDDASPNKRLKRRLVFQKNPRQQASLSSRRRTVTTSKEREYQPLKAINSFKCESPEIQATNDAFINVQYFNVDISITNIPSFTASNPYKNGSISTIDFSNTESHFATSERFDYVAAIFEGYILFPSAGNWTFYLTSDDGSKLTIGNDIIVDNDGIHAPRLINGTIEIEASEETSSKVKPFLIHYFESYGGAELILSWSGPEQSEEVVPINKCCIDEGKELSCTGGFSPSSDIFSKIETDFLPCASEAPSNSPSMLTNSIISPLSQSNSRLFYPELIRKDEHGLRRFPPPLEQNTIRTLSACPGCAMIPKTIPLKIPDWAGTLYSKHVVCDGERHCNHRIPETIHALPDNLDLHMVPNEIIGFSTFKEIDGGNKTRALFLADVNGDELLDIIVGNDEENNQLLINQNDTTFIALDIEDETNIKAKTNSIAAAGNAATVDTIVFGNYGQCNQLLRKTNGKFEVSLLPGGGSYTSSVALGDVNGDGNVDIIIGNVGQPNQLLKNLGNYSFEIITLPGGSTYTEAIAVIGKGKGVDCIVVGNLGQPNQVFRNMGNYVFEEVRDALVPNSSSRTKAVVVGDIDGDGNVDIVFGNHGEPNELFFYNYDGDNDVGFFENVAGGPPGDVSTTTDIAIADLDGDGRLDLLIGNEKQSNQIMRNISTGSKRGFVEVSNPFPDSGLLNTWAIAAGDVDGDSRVDVVRAIAAGDVDGDSRVDVVRVVSGKLDENNMFLLNKQGAIFEEIPNALPTGGSLSTTIMAVANIVGDDNLDIIAGRTYGQYTQLLENKGDGIFEEVAGTPLGGATSTAKTLGFVDLNPDGHLDVLIGNNFGQRNEVFINQGNGTFEEVDYSIVDGTYNTKAFIAGRINEDEFEDFVIGNEGRLVEIVYVYRGLVSVCEIPGSKNTGIQSIALADMDNDGNVDVLVASKGQYSQLQFFRNNGGNCNFTEIKGIFNSTDFTKVEIIVTADINNDTMADIIIGNKGERNQLLINEVNGTTFTNVPIGESSATVAIAIADMDGDGLIDIIVGNDEEPNQLFLNKGSLIFEEIPDAIPGDKSLKTVAIVAADINNDGFVDIIVGNRGAHNQVLLYTSCPNGGARLHGGSWCFRCPTFMGRPEGLSICRECLPDYLQEPGIGETCNNEPCSFEFRKLGQDTCENCEAGTSYNKTLNRFQNDNSSWVEPRCVTCPKGTSSTGAFPYECFECDRGTYKHFTGEGDCVVCEPGKFQPNRGQTECKPCEAGGYCNSAHSENGGFNACAPGFYNNKTGQANDDACTECDPGFFSVFSQQGTQKCTKCPFRLSSTSGSEDCSFCAEGFYLAEDQVNQSELFHNPSKYCKQCPSDTTCTPNTSIQTLSINPGYWRDSTNTAKLYKCANTEICNSSAAPEWQHLQDGENPYCKSGYKGPLCEICENTKAYFSRSKGVCKECPTGITFVLLCILVVICIIGIAFLVRIAVRRMPMIPATISSFSLRAKLKIFISFYQVISSLQVVYGVNLHHRLETCFNFFNLFNLDLFDFIHYPKSCIGSMKRRLVVDGIWPYVLIIFGFVFLPLVRKIFKQSENAKFRKTSLRVVQFAIIVLYFALPVVSRNIFEAKKCQAFRTDDRTDDPAATANSYLVADMDIECSKDNDPRYAELLKLFWLFFVIWPVFTPLLLGLVLEIIKKSVRANSPTRLADSCRFLWEDYNKSMMFWDVVDTSRKIILTGVIMLLDTKEGSNKLLRLIVATVISSMYLGMLATARPYKQDDDFYLALVSNIMLIWCFAMGIILKLCNEDDDDDTNGTCVSLIGVSLDSFKASIVVVAFTIGMLVITILSLVLIARNLIQAPIIRLVRTGYSPIMEMPKNCAYHVFMSHMWATGQAKTHAIARKLKLFLPQLHVWLDVDNLQEMADLENSVSRSTVFILFYSVGYFRSENCRRELYAAIREDKPIIVIYEGDDSVIKELRLECATNCSLEPGSAYILEHMFQNEPIRWLDQGSFSAAAMKMIYTRILGHLPHYEKEDHKNVLESGISVPGEIHQLPLHHSLTIIVCDGNEGALQVAQEIKHISLPRDDIQINTINDAVLKVTASSEHILFEEENAVEIAQGLLEPSRRKKVFLLYLNKDTFLYDNGALKDIIKSAKHSNIDIILVHEIDASNGGCDFGLFFKQTPYELIESPYELYNEIAIPLYATTAFRVVSLRQILRRIDGSSSAND